MIKKISIIIVFLLLICGISTADNYIINDDTVYIDDSKVYLSATPHTLSSSGWVYFNLTSKVYTGDIDVVWGFNTTISKPTKAELYKPYWINTTVDDQKIFYNPTFIIYTGDELDYGNSYNTNYRYTITELIVNENGTTYITSNAAFDSYTTDGTNYTIYWYTRHDNYYLWKDFSPSFNSVIYDYKGYNKWYYIKNIPITSNKEYTVRAWINVPISTEKQFGKYYFAIKPSYETISQAITNEHFYNLDPWWNATWSKRKNIILTGNTSGAQTDYQLLLNVSYDSDMQSDFDDLRFTNETHKLDSWLEFKVDGFYALVWVEFSTTPANTVEQTYYMYYGNAGAASNWDGVATFIQYHGVATANYHDANVVSIPFVWESKVRRTSDADEWFNIGTSDQQITYPIGSGDDSLSLAPHGTIAFYKIVHNNGVESYTQLTPLWTLNQYYNPKIVAISSAEVIFYPYGDATYSTLTTNIPDAAMGLNLYLYRGANAEQKWSFIRKYAANSPTYAFGSEEFFIYIPPDPVTLTNTTGNFWVNHTWAAGSGNVTDGYNVTINSVWHNGTDTFYNDTYSAHAWQNITVWAYNSTDTGTLSSGSISQDTQIPNNAITITNTSDWTGNAGEVVYVDYDATDADSDTATFSCDRIDLFTDFDTTTGKGNWTATANIYYVDFGVSDGYGSTSNYTMTLTESSVKVTLLDELKLIMSEITSGLKSVSMGNYLVYAFILIGILFIILLIQLLNNCIYRG
jgi:hypothetical protein